MKKFFVIAACSALAACGGNDAEDVPEPVDTTVGTTTNAPAGSTDTASAGQMAGAYELTTEDGTVVRQQINADGTYVDRDLEGNEVTRGTWRQQGSQLCYDAAGSAPEECWTGGTPGADGSFEATAADGRTVTIRRTGNTM